MLIMKLCPSLTLSDCPPQPYFTYINTPSWESLRREANINRRKLNTALNNMLLLPFEWNQEEKRAAGRATPQILNIRLQQIQQIIGFGYQGDGSFFASIYPQQKASVIKTVLVFYFAFILSWKPRDVWPGKPASQRPVKKTSNEKQT